LPLVFPLVDALENGKPGFLGVSDGKWLELYRRIKSGKDFAHGFFARRTVGQRLGGERSPQGELPAAHLAIAFAEFVFVDGHGRSLTPIEEFLNWILRAGPVILDETVPAFAWKYENEKETEQQARDEIFGHSAIRGFASESQ
jgi:hypothetical protein